MSKSLSSFFFGTTLVASMALLSGCGGGSSGSSAGVSGASGAFFVRQTLPPSGGMIYLNQTIQVEFTQEVDLGSVDFNSFSFSSFDPNTGIAAGETVIGEFRYLIDGGVLNRRVIEFLPTFPSNDTFDNGGFRPGRRYEVHINGGDTRGTPVIRSTAGRPVAQGHDFGFGTPTGKSPKELFFDSLAGGPARLSLSPSGTVEKLNFFLGSEFKEVRLVFDQPLNPASTNFNLSRIFLEYNDPELNPRGMTKIDSVLTLARNLPERAEVTLIPKGILPSNAEVRVIVDREVQDLSGESNVGDPAYDRVFGTFRTEPALGFQYDTIVEEFADTAFMDLEAPHREPLADWKNGRLKAAFEFGGSTTLFDFEPTATEVILSTDFAQVVPKQGIPFTVSGGVFQFRNITIPQGVKVRAQGSNPLVFLATGEVNVYGLIAADGSNGARVDTLNAANFATPGGFGACGGGSGGAGSPNTTNSSAKGEDGYGPYNRIGGGGKGGHTAYPSGTGAGAGGGSFSTQGDPQYGITSFLHMTGVGGNGTGTDAVTRSGVPKGGQPGPVAFTDADPNNNFHGRDVRLVGGRETVIMGELNAPLPGQGGGGGGDLCASTFPTGANFANDNKGGGGGGGGGIVIIKAIGRVIVWPQGRITANGGDGGGGEQAGANNQGGGGAGGSGGMVVIQSATEIDIKNRSGAAPELFGVSADGGVGFNGTFSGGGFESKYPARNAGNVNRGAFGGLGLVQLMAPDPNNNIKFTTGQVKPAPVLLPSDFGYLSRARSRWIVTGATTRQTDRPQDPRYLDNSGEPGKFGPEYRFAGVHTGGVQLGYLDYRTAVSGPGNAVGWVYNPELAEGTLAAATPAGSSEFHVATAQGAVLGVENGLRGAAFQVVQGGTVIGEWRVLGNTETTLYLATGGQTPFTSTLAGSAFKVVAKYVDVWTDGRPGLPIRVDGKDAYPTASIKIGFAACSGLDQDGRPINRYPATDGQFAYDLETAAREALWKDGQGKLLARPLVMFDVLFNLAYNPTAPNLPRSGANLTPDTPLPELLYLMLPYRF